MNAGKSFDSLDAARAGNRGRESEAATDAWAPTSIEPGRLYDVKEAARLLHARVKPHALLSAIASERLRSVEIGRVRLVPGADLARFIQSLLDPKCRVPTMVRSSSSTVRIPGTAPGGERGSGTTYGTSSGPNAAPSASEARALETARRLSTRSAKSRKN